MTHLIHRWVLVVLMGFSQACGKAEVLKLQAPLRFLVAGQSNSVSPANGAPPIASQTGLVTINDYYHDRGRLRVPTDTDPNDSGFTWIKLGDLMNRPVLFNLVGQGGTSSQQWVDTLYTNIIDALREQPYSAIIWVQGENDVELQIDPEVSYQNLKTVITRSREVQANIPWFVALDGASALLPHPVPNNEPARVAQQRLISEGVVMAGADLDVLRADPNNFEPTLGELAGPGFDRFAAEWLTILRPHL